MSKFAYFNFTCGNFTQGRGHLRHSKHIFEESPEMYIKNNLEKGGEKNCRVIMERYNDVEGEMPKSGSHMNYQIDQRWYSHLPMVIGSVAPFLGSAILKELNK